MSIPTLDYSLVATNKPQFLKELRDALFNIGFFYLSNPPKAEQLFPAIKDQSLKFFEIPLEEKKKVAMVNSPHFLGYNGLGDEITANGIDWREQVEFATELPAPQVIPGEEWRNIEGPNMWPNENLLPQFKPVVNNYIHDLSQLSIQLATLIEEALDLPTGSLLAYFKETQQAKLKIIKYPNLSASPESVDAVLEEYKSTDTSTQLNQGVGEHRDNDFLTLIFQASHHQSLQVKSFQGAWIDVPPVDNTLVFAVGLTLEFLTQGLCVSTVHRVLTPEPGSGDRLSISFFQTISIESRQKALKISDESKGLVSVRDATRAPNKIGFQFPVDSSKPVGYSVFLNRIKSHPKVGQRFYPETLKWVEEVVTNAEKL